MLKTSVTIAAVTLALVTAGIAAVVVSMMIPVQTAHASCVTSPKGDQACSGGGSPFSDASTSSFSRGIRGGSAASGPSGSFSFSENCSSGGGCSSHQSFSHNFEGVGNCADTTCSGNK